ncbi:BTB/POZ domain-containing protein 9-like protein [Leptotrombidium deliense]|uniref:BTB/POZ domain-containing protein 9-like protein n=1 Tax=Leptotrombidium deliense TaxID=299467 RepID=A0A443RX63_9ACAR|nr:BTB/POZ domain-containing protein 9-like protein [Leptotrombidium deliense]
MALSTNGGIDNLRKLYSEGKYSDVTFVVEDEAFKVHKMILASSCPYFDAMLFGETNESKMKTIRLNNTPKIAFKLAIQYIYTSEIIEDDLNQEAVFELLCLANEYMYPQLVKYALSRIDLSNLNLDVLPDILDIAIKFELDEFKEKCLQKFDSSAEAVVGSENIFTKLSLELVRTLLSRDTFAANETNIFRAIIKWFNVNGKPNEWKSLVKQIRWNFITVADLLSEMNGSRILKFEDYSSIDSSFPNTHRNASQCCDICEKAEHVECIDACYVEVKNASSKRQISKNEADGRNGVWLLGVMPPSKSVYNTISLDFDYHEKCTFELRIW